jgi:thiol-disulfide isomerase/thioredoxin
LLVALALLLLVPPTLAQKLIYPPSDPARDIAAALAAAKADNKNVLLDFGADWCPDCRVLGALFEDAAVAPYIDANFHVVHIDIGRRDKNADVVAKYGATSGDWIPAVVVIDAGGKTVGLTTDEIRLTRRDTPETLLPVLRRWAPKKSSAQSFFANGVGVTLTLEENAGPSAWLTAVFSPADDEVHLYSKDLPRNGIDGLGRPTRVEADASSSVRITGAGVADRPVQQDVIPALNLSVPVYPAGPVTLRFPVKRFARGPAVFRISYMGCGRRGCLAPVVGRRLVLPLTAGRGR